MAEILPALASAIAKGWAPFLLFYCDHPSGVTRAWSRTGVLRHDGFDWVGYGILGRISGATRSTDLAINEVTFELRGVPPTAVSSLYGLVKNRVAQVTRGAISKRGETIVDNEPMIDALLDFQTLSTDPASGTATIKLVGQQGFYTLDRAQDIAFSDQQQVSEYPDDTGLSLLHTLVNRDSNWRAA